MGTSCPSRTWTVLAPEKQKGVPSVSCFILLLSCDNDNDDEDTDNFGADSSPKSSAVMELSGFVTICCSFSSIIVNPIKSLAFEVGHD